MDKILYIVAGANGSGKTTFSKNLMNNNGYNFINADEIAKQFDPDNKTGGEIKAGREFFKRIDTEIEASKSFIIESTLSGNYIISLIERVQKINYKVVIIYIYLENPRICIERINERVLNGGHFVPDEAVIRRFFRSKNKFWNVYKNIADKWFLIYNSDLNFKEICAGSRTTYKIHDIVMHKCFMKDLEDE